MVDYDLTKHAQESLAKRSNIRLEWLQQVLEKPQKIESDAIDPELEHRLGRIDEYEGRVLRVIVQTAVTPLRIVTAYFDRTMRNKL